MVKIALKDVVSSKGLLAAHVAQGFNSDGLSERRRDKKGKGKVENWRQRPVRSGVFQRTLPGELSRVIIVARKFHLLQQVTPTTAVVLRDCLMVKRRRKEG